MGLLDLIEESQDARDKSDSTNELCLIDDKTDSDALFESSMPFSPIPDTTNTSGPFRTKFPAVLNSSYGDQVSFILKTIDITNMTRTLL